MHRRMAEGVGMAVLGLALLAPAGTPAGAASKGTTPAGVSVPSPVCRPRSTPVPSGPATFVSQTSVAGTGGRVHDIVLYSPAMGGDEHVDVLVPPGYDPSGATRYPVLYLLHGAGGSYRDWVDHGVESDIDDVSVADHLGPFITVMPDDGAWGFYTDWYGSDLVGHSTYPPPAYATYDIDELIPWIDGHYPTIASRAGRAVAGLSMGGFGAMSYAARYPDLFAAAGSFSGAVDTDIDFPVGGEGLNLLSSDFTEGPPDQCVWGDTLTQGVRWHAGDPTYLAQNLAGVSLFVASGNGSPGIYDTPGKVSTVEDGLIESFIYVMNQNFVSALDAAHVSYTGYFYGPGTHSWGYWLRDLAHFLPQMSGVFAHPSAWPPATPFNFRTVDTSFSTHGYRFSIRHVAEEFTYLSNVSSAGLTAVGTGTLEVLSAPDYLPGNDYRVTIDATSPAHAGPTILAVRADGSGRLTFDVDLGPPDPVQQSDFSPNDPNSFPQARVTITRM